MNDIIPTPEATQALEAVQIVENRIDAYVHRVLNTPAEYRTAAEELPGIKAARKRIDEARKAMTRPIDAAKAAIMDFFRVPSDRLDDAERRVKNALLAYDAGQEKIRRQEQAELDRKAAEDRAFAEARAARASAEGRQDDAQELQQQAAASTAPVVVRESPSVQGVSYREVWKYVVEDPALVPREYLMLDEQKIRRYGEAMKDTASIAGVRFYKDKIIAARAR